MVGGIGARLRPVDPHQSLETAHCNLIWVNAENVANVPKNVQLATSGDVGNKTVYCKLASKCSRLQADSYRQLLLAAARLTGGRYAVVQVPNAEAP